MSGETLLALRSTVEFVTHHQAEVVAGQPGDAAQKGTVERPFRHYKETFLEELEGVSLDTRSGAVEFVVHRRHRP